MRISQFYYQDPRPSNFESIELARIMMHSWATAQTYSWRP